MNPAVSVLVVSYNTRDRTVRCLDTLFAATRGNIEVIVVDNASHDGSAKLITERFPAVTVLASHDNLGFARGVNRGAERATGRYLLLLNPDTEVLDGAVDRLVAFAEQHEASGIYGGRTLHADGSLDPRSCSALPSVWGLTCFATGLSTALPRSAVFNPEALGGWRRNHVRHVPAVSGSLLLARAEVFHALGGLDERYFMYGEDIDFCLRAGRVGHRPLFTPDVAVIHEGGASSSRHAAKTTLVMKGKATLIESHWRGRRRVLGRWLLATGVALRAAAAAVTQWVGGGKGAAWREVWRNRHDWTRGYDEAQPSDALGATRDGVHRR